MTLRNLLASAALLIAAPAFAADNFNVIQAGGQTRIKAAKDIGGDVLADKNVLVDDSGARILGEVTASPAANTIGARLKAAVDALQALTTALGSPLQAGGTVAVTGVSTAANQATGNSSLSTIATQTNLKKTTTNVLASPQTGVCNGTGTNGCKETRTQLSDNTAAVICPATANVYAVVLYNTVADLGISLSGSTSLNSRVVNATSLSTSPSYNIATAGVWQPLPVGFTGAISAYGAGQWVTCLQFIEQ